MSHTSKELELSVQPSSHCDAERGRQPPPLPPAQDPAEARLWFDLQQVPLAQQQSGSPPQSPKRQQLILLLVLGFCSCAAVLGLVYYISCGPSDLAAPCLSQACQWASTLINKSADPFTRPCDYFLFSCGSERPPPDSRARQRKKGVLGPAWSTDELDRSAVLLRYLRGVLESNYGNDSSAVQKTRWFYTSCLDTSSINAAGAEPFLALVEELGGWAVMGKWNQTDFNSTLLNVLMRDFSTFPFFNVFVGKDPRDSGSNKSRRYIQIDQPDLMIPIEWNSKTQKSRANTQSLRLFLASCQKYLSLLGVPTGSSMMHVWTFVSLSSELAVAAAPLGHRLSQGQLHQRLRIGELQVQAPAIDWLDCLRTVFHPHPFTEEDLVLVHNLPYIVQMSQTIAKWMKKQDLRTSGPLNTYMILNLLHTLMPALDSRFSLTARNVSASWRDSDGVVPRWKRCVLETEKGFDAVLKHLLRELATHREAGEMVQNMFSSLKTELQELKWKNETAQQYIMKKVQSLSAGLEMSTEIPSLGELDLMFARVSVSRLNFFSNYVRLLSLWQQRRCQLLMDPTDRADAVEFSRPSLSVTPTLQENRLVFPMGMFVPPLFHPTYPRAVNYGVMGFLVAKDVLHLLLPHIWFQSDSVRNVGECVWAHYLSVTGGSGGVGALSQEQQQEVWVQQTALQVALKGYDKSLKRNPTDSSISGLSHSRLLLTSFSQITCAADPSHPLMPLHSSFLVSSICADSPLCPSRLQCLDTTDQHLPC
ncbi:kell blood group glycoprotein isoform X2 [Synchiropus splendidus]|uniref:kell blood group glycoprotein isoform X2 n=1 Tax=Synchiropus splendidus TaxID=270530 RepID=UPI00237EE531|nr:kell blood group glycoprotein isoform X2 [Synchiropus splendidus]